jgi:phosphatidylserine decarboxylase
MGRLARLPIPKGFRRGLWAFVAKRLGIDTASVPGDLRDYPNFQSLFTRPLPADSRPIPPGDHWLSPADGKLVTLDRVYAEGSWVIKGTPYSTRELVPGGHLDGLLGYQALQIYLSPKDYHRYHTPCKMKVLEAVVEPGDLQPVDPSLVRRSMRVLATNRRILLHCESSEGLRFSMLFVGALNVGGIRFVFDDTLGIAPWARTTRRYDPAPELQAGDVLGWFEFGSTVVLFAPPELRPLADVGATTVARTPLLTALRGPEVANLEESL